MTLLSLLKPAVKIEANIQYGVLRNSMSMFCKIVGHSWQYKDYSNWMKENGDHYDFKASRKCSTCDQYEYLSDKWEKQVKRSSYDIIGDTHLLKKLPHMLTS